MSEIEATAPRVALVTGASRGIGRAIAATLAAAGMRVVGTATTDAGAAAIGESLAAYSGSSGLRLDVTEPAGASAAIEAVIAKHGALHVLVNNAGITRDMLAPRLKDEDWAEVLDTNLGAVFRLCRSAMRGMVRQRYGRIVNITSVVGATGNAGQANYAAAKAGLAGMSRSLARELAGRNITVNCVAPGFVETDMTAVLPEAHRLAVLGQIPMARMGTPEEVAHAVAFLASSEASYITGVELHVNGGMFMA